MQRVDAPERIWLSAADDDNEHDVWFDPDEGGTEYVRSDIAESTIAHLAEAKLAKVEALWHETSEQAVSNFDNWLETIADRDRLSAELAETWQNYVDANEARLDGIRVLEKVADAHMPGQARRLAVEHLRAARSFLASKEASHAE